MADLTGALQAAAGTAASAGGAADPNFNQTVLLLHGDGTNGAQNNTFLDSSTNNFTITRNGNTTQGTFSPFSNADGEWSNYFDGSGDYLTAGSASDWTFLSNGAQDYTIEAFVYLTETPSTQDHIVATNAASASSGYRLYIDSSLNVVSTYTRGVSGSNLSVTSSSAITLNAWHYIAVTFTDSTNTCEIYINGVSDNSGVISAFSASAPPDPLNIGREPSAGGGLLTGYISNLRISSSIRTVTSIPTSPFTSDANTSILTCQSNRFIDNSSNAFALTPAGDVAVQPFSPFAPSAAYSPSVNGGSGYFDGTGDYLTSPSVASLSGDFTMEFWIYPTVATNGGICGIGNYTTTTGLCLYQRVNRVSIFINNTESSIGATGLLLNNSWNHVALVRSSGVFKIYTNGVAGTTLSNSATFNDTLYVNAIFGGTVSARPNSTYVSNFRIETSAVYTSDFTPPTAPPSPTGSSVCLLMQNAGILDNTGKNNLETVADAQIDTSVKKYGTGSMEFDGTGDYLEIADTPDLRFGTGPFTIEGWLYANTLGVSGIVCKGTSATDGWNLRINSSNKLELQYNASSVITSSASLTTGSFIHVCVVREGTGTNQTKLYINGTNDGTGTVSSDFNQTVNMLIGVQRNRSDSLDGFIDDLRITRGVARYTANFTPPTAPFPDQ